MSKQLRFVPLLIFVIIFASCATTDTQRVTTQPQLEYEEIPILEDYITEEFPRPDQWAMYPGGNAALNRTIQLSIRIPEQARRDGYAGRVILSYIVDENGNAGQVEALMSPNEAITEMYKDIIAGLQQWKPAMLDGKPVAQRYYITTTFRDSNAEEDS